MAPSSHRGAETREQVSCSQGQQAGGPHQESQKEPVPLTSPPLALADGDISRAEQASIMSLPVLGPEVRGQVFPSGPGWQGQPGCGDARALSQLPLGQWVIGND